LSKLRAELAEGNRFFKIPKSRNFAKIMADSGWEIVASTININLIDKYKFDWDMM
jgi:hypothetical protein